MPHPPESDFPEWPRFRLNDMNVSGEILDPGAQRHHVWGLNEHGQFGDGTTNNSSTPVLVSGLSNMFAFAAGKGHTVAIKSDGTLWSWGRNNSGQLGDGTTTDSATPMHVPALSGVIQFAMGEGHTVALKTDGTLRSWGRNDSGQLGDGTLVNRLRPVQVTMKDGTSLSNVTMLCAGYGHTKVLRFETVVPSNHVHGLAFADLSPEARKPVPEDDNVRGIASCSP